MGWATPPDALVARFTSRLPDDPRIERRSMFGCPCAFIGGQMFAGVFRDTVFVRLPADARAALLGAPGTAPFEPRPGRVMREYICVPSTDRRLRAWLAAARTYAASLPPKAPRATARRRAPRR